MFPRGLYANSLVPLSGVTADVESITDKGTEKTDMEHGMQKSVQPSAVTTVSPSGEDLPDIPARTYRQMLSVYHYYPQNKTTFWEYFRRPFVLFLFPNIIVVSR